MAKRKKKASRTTKAKAKAKAKKNVKTKKSAKPKAPAKAPGRKRRARRSTKRASSGTATNLSLSELQSMLTARQNEVSKLQQRRATLASELAKVDAELARHLGTRRGPGRPPKAAGPAQPAKKGSRPSGSMRGKLPELIRKVLAASKKPMKLREIADGVVAAGYPTSSSRFSVIVGQRLAEMKGVAKAGHGVYKLK